MEVNIIKSSGEKEPFIRNKLIQSLLRAGASSAVAEEITVAIEKSLEAGTATRQIYRKAHDALKGASRLVAGRYHLKAGIMELGPSGFPFEQYVSEILLHLGYRVQVGINVSGKCVNHEIDVIAQKNDQHFMIECKYHNSPAMVCDVKIPLYIQARFKDVEAQWKTMPGHGKKFHQGWVVTNTRFTTDAINYGTCAGLNLVSLDFPAEGSLREMIEQTGLYPLTCLTTLTLKEKKLLLEQKILLCRDVCNRPDILRNLQIPESRVVKILHEGNQLCHKLTHYDQY